MEEKKKSGLATAGMVLGIVGICTSFIPLINNLSFVMGILAAIFGIVALIKKAGTGKAIVGLVLGILAIVITLNSQKALSDALDDVTNAINDGITQAENEGVVDLAMFNQIETGMTYQEVVNIIGEEGTVTSESEVGNIKSSIYSWKGKGSFGANVSIIFQDNKVSSKSQYGLK